MNIAKYHARRLRTLRGKTVLHVGAHYAEEAESYESVGAKRVIWVEAAPDTFAKLNEILAARDPNRRSRLQRALRLPPTQHLTINALAGADNSGEVQFHRFNNQGASDSIFKLSQQCKTIFPELAATGEAFRLPFRKLDNIIGDLGISPSEINTLVLDIQGAELLCLQGATEILRHVRYLETEISTTPIYDGGVLFEELNEFLAANRFKCKTRIRRVHMNAIYVAA